MGGGRYQVFQECFPEGGRGMKSIIEISGMGGENEGEEGGRVD